MTYDEYRRWAGDQAMPEDAFRALRDSYPSASPGALHRIWQTPPVPSREGAGRDA